MQKKTDRRVRKTKAQLRAGLTKLMRTKSIKEISVKELVDEVDINRSTFYLHYADIFDMLEKIENELMEEFIYMINHYPAKNLKELHFPLMTNIFSFIYNNADICYALMGPYGDITFVNKMKQMISDMNLKTLISMVPASVNDLELISSFCITGCIGIIENWLKGGTKEPPEYMSELTGKIMTNAIKTFIPEETK
ncbi:TetR/AcrR family transcriptional regulator [Anaerosacchariphilus polymeriproducens]|uniref:TetR/AcrR family transcriptional regulator n=1 Tax=Anaerosacchariphilus polymeriproducens TaxID=1812858 RepID=A0A371ATR6_9FIRM|nr:TetR-like C-terminal domain-containing protein [Anaerosacchariphilus polymeriproducens]RDU22942.1 TetR/AcrR family transcriptional regulator [Anaerosacchariphilus polymeriproducens]